MKGWLVAAALALLIATAVGSCWVGMHWQKGRDAIAQLSDARATVDAATKQINDYNTTLHQSTLRFQHDADALRAIAEDNANGNAQRQQFATALTARLDTYLAAHPPVAACDLGPDGLKLWNDANQGATAQPDRIGPTAAGIQAGPIAADGVPGFATRLFWKIGRVDAQPSADHDAVPRLPGIQGGLGEVGAQKGATGNRAADTGAGFVKQVHAALIKATGDGW